MVRGSCLCGDISFTVKDGSRSVAACHCTQCRKMSGHYWAAGYDDVANITITGDVRWYASSDSAKRGFCPRCGSSLFWKAHDEDGMSFALGALDGPTGLALQKHIFVASKGDYYDIADGLPQKED
ncbi:MAG: GFA family protein [Pseudomonadota bacterium]